MQANRDPIYKTALLRAIRENNFRDAEDAINFCLSMQDGIEKLTYGRDDDNRSYLSYAFECGAIEIARRLYPLIGDQKSILLNVDKYDRSLLWHAICYEDLAVDISEKLKRLGCEDDVFSAIDVNGVSLLKVAALHGKNVILLILLDSIAKNPNAQKIINHKDIVGNPALVNSMFGGTPETTRLLLERGAAWDGTSFYVFSHQPIERQLEIFTTLKKDNQADLLKFWRSELLSKPDNSALKELYFKFAGRHSLKALTAAHYEMGKNAHLQLPFKFVNGSLIVNNDALGALRDSAPIFYETLKLKFEKAKEKQSIDVKNFEETSPAQHSLFAQHVIVKDDVTLLGLIADIERILESLRVRPTSYSVGLRVATIGIPIVFMLCWIVPLITVLVLGGKYKNSGYGDAAMMIGALGGLVGIGAALGSGIPMGIFLWDKQFDATISHHEWDALLSNLQKNVLDNLERIEKSQQETNEPLLEIIPEVKGGLEIEVEKLKHDNKTTQAIVIFSRLVELLGAIRYEMNRTKRPLSLLFADQNDDLELGQPARSNSLHP